MQDVLVAEPGGRPPRPRLVLVAVLLLGAVLTPVALRQRPPAPLRVTLASLDGSALQGESFVRLQLVVRAEGASELGPVRLLLGDVSARGLSPDGLDDGRATVQVDLVPPCGDPVASVQDASLDVEVVDDAGRSRTVRLALPDDGPLARLVSYRCG